MAGPTPGDVVAPRKLGERGSRPWGGPPLRRVLLRPYPLRTPRHGRCHTLAGLRHPVAPHHGESEPAGI